MKKVVFLVITGVATSLSVIAQTQTAVTDLIKLDVRQFDELSEYIPGMQMQLQSPNNPGYVIRGVTSDDGFINTPIVKDRLLNRFAFTYEDRDGFIKNLSGGDLNGKNTFALRNSTRLFAGENTLVDLVLDYQRDDYPGTSFKNGQYAPAGGDVSPNTMADLEQGKNLYINMISGLCGKSPATRGTYLLRRGTFPATCGTFHATRGTCSPLRGEVTDVRTTLPEALKNPIEYQGNAPVLCGTFPASCGTFPASCGTYPLRRGTFPATCGTYPAKRGEWPQALQKESGRRRFVIIHDINRVWKFNAISGFRAFNSDKSFDADGTASPLMWIPEIEKGKQFSQEFRFNYTNPTMPAKRTVLVLKVV